MIRAALILLAAAALSPIASDMLATGWATVAEAREGRAAW